MRHLFGRPFGGMPPTTGRFDPSAKKAEEEKPEDDPAAVEDDEEEETPAVVEDEKEEPEAEEGDEEDDATSATAAERGRWVGVLSQLDMPPAACAAVEALGEGLSPEAALRIANRNAVTPPKPDRAAALATRRGKRPAVPQSSGGTTDPGAERRERLGAHLDRVGHPRTKKG